MGQGSRWAAASFRGFWRNALGLWPLAVATVVLHGGYILVSDALGIDGAARDLANARAGSGQIPGSSVALLFVRVLLFASFGAMQLCLGLMLWSPEGITYPWRVAWKERASRFWAVAGAGLIITLAWFVPLNLGPILDPGRGAASGILTILAIGLLIYVAGRRYMAMPIALNEGQGAWRSLQESRSRLAGKRKSVTRAVFLIVPVLVVLVPLVDRLVLGLQRRLEDWPSWQQAVPAAFGWTFDFIQYALLSRLAWEVYHDLTFASDELPPVSRISRAWVTVRLWFASWTPRG